MALDAGTIIGKAKLDTSNFVKGVDTLNKKNKDLKGSLDQADSGSKKLLSSFQGLAKKSLALTTAFTAVGAVIATAIGVKAVRAASDMQESMSKFNVTFSTIKNQAKSMAKEIEKGWGLSSKAAVKMLGDTGDLLKGFGFAEKQALDLSSGVVKLGADLASFSNYSGGAEGATHALSKALLGETEGVKALGIAITVADIKRLAKDHGIVGELTRQQKAMLIYKLAVQQSQGAIGDFQRSQGTFANESKISAQRIENIFVRFGQGMIEPITEIIASFNNMLLKVDPVINSIGDKVGDFINYINSTFSEINLTPLVNTLTETLRVVGKTVGGLAKGAVDFIASVLNYANREIVKFKLYWSGDKENKETLKKLKDLEGNVRQSQSIINNIILNGSSYTRKKLNALDFAYNANQKAFKSLVNQFNKLHNTTLSTTTQTYEEIVKKMQEVQAEAKKGVQDFFNETASTAVGLGVDNMFDNLADSIEKVGESAEESASQVKKFSSATSDLGSGDVEVEQVKKERPDYGFSFKGSGAMGFVSKFSGAMETAGTANVGDFLSGLNTQELVGVIGEFSNAVGGVVQDSLSGIFDVLTLGFENELKMIDKARRDEEKLLEDQYRGVEGKEEEFQRKKEELRSSYQKKEDEIKQKQFEADKANKIANITMSAAQGIAQAWLTAIATTGPAAPVLAPAIAGTLTALILANTTAQTAMIASQQYIPSYAVGGTHSGGTARINERGGELVNLPDGTIIVPNDISKQIATGTQEPQQINYFTINSNQPPEIIANEVSRILARRLE